MTYRGIVRGSSIELEHQLSLPDGTRVRVDLCLEETPPKGSPRRVLQLAGTLTDAEAEVILKGAQLVRRVDASLWGSAE